MKPVFIYTLEHPTTGEIRYVGKTVNPSMRFKNHCNKLRDEKTHKRNWITGLKSQKLRPIMRMVDELNPNEDWKYWEKYWIQQFKQWGFNLVNHTEGGDGLSSGNSTSFKKGMIPWNTGKAKPKQPLKGTRGKEPGNIVNHFKSGFIPWNKGKFGYSTKKKGISLPESVRKKISATLMGRDSLIKKSVAQFDINNNLINNYNSVTEARINTGFKGIGSALSGRSKTSGGYIWKYT